MYLGLPFPRDQSSIWSLSVQWDISKGLILAHLRKVKKGNLFKNVITLFGAPTQIHNHAYNVVGIYSEKTGYRHRWYRLCFTQQQRTTTMALYFT
jgi:hypothetical protein